MRRVVSPRAGAPSDIGPTQMHRCPTLQRELPGWREGIKAGEKASKPVGRAQLPYHTGPSFGSMTSAG